MDNSNKIVPPHLNAEVYRTDTTGTDTVPYLDYIYLHSGNMLKKYLLALLGYLCHMNLNTIIEFMWVGQYTQKVLFIRRVCYLTDGNTLIGCSELTGRYWNGGASVFRDVTEAQERLKDAKKNIYLTSGTPDGIFVVDSTKVGFHYFISFCFCSIFFNNKTRRPETNNYYYPLTLLLLNLCFDSV